MKLLSVCAFLLTATAAEGQVMHDTLAPAEVKSTALSPELKNSFSEGTKQTEIHTTPADNFHSLATLLTARSTAFIKSTGLNTFSTLSLRGASAAQSAVYWEGVPLMNGATGLTDISILPVGLFSSVRLDYGSSAALWGSGNVGGAVMLQDALPLFRNLPEYRISLDAAAGSFGMLNAGCGISRSTKRLFISGNITAGRSENNFPAQDETGKTFTTENARQGSYNASGTAAYRLSQCDQLTARLQYYRYDRQIPRALFESSSQKQQLDEGYRALLHWKHQLGDSTEKRGQVYAKLAALGNVFDYTDSAIGLTSNYHNRQLFAEIGIDHQLFKGDELLVFLPVQYLSLDNAANSPHQMRVAIAGAYTHKGKSLKPSFVFRLESIDGKVIFLPGLNARYALGEQLSIRANTQYTYRTPTLNELYYNPGGNSGLKPERGWNIDGGLEWQVAHKHNSYRLGFSVYDRSIKDWIIWLGGAIWTPHNLAAVHSRGIELENAFCMQLREVQVSVALNASYTRSTVLESYLTGDNSIGRQIPYVPLFAANSAVSLSWKSFRLEWTSTYTGMRFTVSDESQALPGYAVSNLSLLYALRDKYFLSLVANNLFNQQYSVVAFRPMPGINWSLSVDIRLRNRD